MKILITGQSSFVGKKLTAYLAKCGNQVVGTARKVYAKDSGTYEWCFGQEVRPEWFINVDTVLHLAWDISATAEYNYNQTKKIAEVAAAAGVPRQVFVSSCSAHPQAQSQYGMGKFKAESIFTAGGHTVVRPGLVIGSGGGFKAVYEVVCRGRFIPLLDGGLQRVPFIGLSDLAVAFHHIVKDPSIKKANLFSDATISFQIMIRNIANYLGKKIYAVPVNSGLLLFFIHLCERFRVPVPVTSEQLLGYRSNNHFDFIATRLPGLSLDKSFYQTLEQEMKGT